MNILGYTIIAVDDGSDIEYQSVFEVLKGCITAYNLDGGGSSTMYFNGEIVNIPTDGHKFGERSVSDVVYIGK